jgi:uncharacterized DUF497 family protein
MRIIYDPAKRDAILQERGLDFAQAGQVFDGFHLTRSDDKHSESEDRFVSVGMLDEDVVIVVWTPREEGRRIVTMWKTNEKERSAYYRKREEHG